MKIIITGPAAAFDSGGTEITSPERLRQLDGVRYDDDVCSNYLDTPPLDEIGIIGGSLQIAFKPEPGGLRVVTEYHAPRALKPRELAALVEETRAQWSDGLGEGAFDAYADETGIRIDLFPTEPRGEVTAEQVDDGVKVPRKRYSPLLKAAEAGDTAKIAKLLARGEPVNCRDRYGFTPLHLAIQGRHTEAALLLIERGADVNAAGDEATPPLSLAAMRELVEVARALLDRGAEVDARDDRGATPLMWAANRGAIETARLLLDRGADPNAQDTMEGDAGSTPLMYLSPRYPELGRLLLARGADPQVRNGRELSAPEYHRDQLQANMEMRPGYMTPERVAEFEALIRLLEGR